MRGVATPAANLALEVLIAVPSDVPLRRSPFRYRAHEPALNRGRAQGRADEAYHWPMRPLARGLLLAAVLISAGACSTSSHVLIGTARPPISPESVRVYYRPPPRYEEIATIQASSQGSMALTSQQNMDKAIARLKAEAAKLGANGVLLQGVQDTQGGSIGVGGGSSSYGPGSAVGVGAGGSFALTNKLAEGLAIYVPPQ